MPAPTYYNALTNLRGATPVSGDYAQTYYHSAATDQGGGLWRAVTGASPGTYDDDDGTVIVPTSGDGSSAWLRVYQGAVQAEWFGLLSAGTDLERTAALQSAIDVGKDVVIPAGDFRVNSISTSVSLSGAGQALTTLRAGDEAAYLLRVSGRVEISDMTLTGEYLTDCVVSLTGSNGSHLRAITVEHGKIDNVVFEATGNNNNSVISGSLLRICGREYSTGTAAGTLGGSVVTLTGATNPIDFGFREGIDWIYLADDAAEFAYEVTNLTSNTVTVYPPLASTFTASAYKLIQGANVRIARQGDNSRITIRETTIQVAKGPGIQDQSLYGAISIGNVIESNGYGRTLGRRGTPAEALYDAQEIGVYYEASTYVDTLYAYSIGELVRLGGAGSSQTQAVFTGSFSPTIITCGTPKSRIPATGLQFPAVAVNSPDPNILDAYAEGDWTPIDDGNGGLNFSAAIGRYQRIGRQVTVTGSVTYPSNSDPNAAVIGGLPFTQTYAWQGAVVTWNTSPTAITLAGSGSTQFLVMRAASGSAVTNQDLSGARIDFTSTYELFP